MKNLWPTAIALCLLMGATTLAAEKSVFDRSRAVFTSHDAKFRPLLVGCKLYSDKEFVMKQRPRELSQTRYVLGPFGGATVHCQKGGVAFMLALLDPISGGQTESVKTYLAANHWTQLPDVAEFALYYTNGADRPARVYWREIAKDEDLTCPTGSVLCYRFKQ